MSTKSRPNSRRVDVPPTQDVKPFIQFGKHRYKVQSIRMNPKIKGAVIAIYVHTENLNAPRK